MLVVVVVCCFVPVVCWLLFCGLFLRGVLCADCRLVLLSVCCLCLCCSFCAVCCVLCVVRWIGCLLPVVCNVFVLACCVVCDIRCSSLVVGWLEFGVCC